MFIFIIHTYDIYQWIIYFFIFSISFKLYLLGDVNALEYLHQWSPLHYAAQGNHLNCVRLLLSAGADPLYKSPDGVNCQDVATGECIDYFNSSGIMKFLSFNFLLRFVEGF